MKTKNHKAPTGSKKKEKPKKDKSKKDKSIFHKKSDAGKGDKSRVSDTNKYAENWERIFGKNKK